VVHTFTGVAMTNDEFKIFRNLVHRECGIFLNEGKRDFLKARVSKRLTALAIGSFYQYYKYITDKNRDELCLFIDSVTINETNFFRNAPQFEMFREKALPEMLGKKRRLRDYSLSIWSAGCATGEEPYSIAMEVVEAVPDASLWNIRIVASDISLRCLDIASRGVYLPEKLNDVPERYLAQYFKRLGERYEARDNIKKLVVFDYHNLTHENGVANMDMIFCRNVMIYFQTEDQKKIVARFANALNSDGYLFLGHAESLQGLTSNGDFRFVYSNKGTAYQRVRETHG